MSEECGRGMRPIDNGLSAPLAAIAGNIGTMPPACPSVTSLGRRTSLSHRPLRHTRRGLTLPSMSLAHSLHVTNRRQLSAHVIVYVTAQSNTRSFEQKMGGRGKFTHADVYRRNGEVTSSSTSRLLLVVESSA